VVSRPWGCLGRLAADEDDCHETIATPNHAAVAGRSSHVSNADDHRDRRRRQDGGDRRRPRFIGAMASRL
jgi:hypothetical protein